MDKWWKILHYKSEGQNIQIYFYYPHLYKSHFVRWVIVMFSLPFHQLLRQLQNGTSDPKSFKFMILILILCQAHILLLPSKSLDTYIKKKDCVKSQHPNLQNKAWTYLQLPLRQWGAGNVYLLVLYSWKVNIVENPIAVMEL